MRKLVVTTFTTLDGVMQAPGGPEEDPTNGFNSGGWTVNYWDDIMGQIMSDFMAKPFDLLLGRKTYETFASYWPYTTEPGADLFNNAKKYVASRTLKQVNWNNSTLIKGDVAQEIRKLKQQDGPELQVHGSSNLIQTLLQSNLVDRFIIWIFPVVVGNGKRLFDQGTIATSLKLVDSKTSSTGVIVAFYEPTGELKTGTFALASATEAQSGR